MNTTCTLFLKRLIAGLLLNTLSDGSVNAQFADFTGNTPQPIFWPSVLSKILTGQLDYRPDNGVLPDGLLKSEAAGFPFNQPLTVWQLFSEDIDIDKTDLEELLNILDDQDPVIAGFMRWAKQMNGERIREWLTLLNNNPQVLAVITEHLKKIEQFGDSPSGAEKTRLLEFMECLTQLPKQKEPLLKDRELLTQLWIIHHHTSLRFQSDFLNRITIEQLRILTRQPHFCEWALQFLDSYGSKAATWEHLHKLLIRLAEFIDSAPPPSNQNEFHVCLFIWWEQMNLRERAHFSDLDKIEAIAQRVVIHLQQAHPGLLPAAVIPCNPLIQLLVIINHHFLFAQQGMPEWHSPFTLEMLINILDAGLEHLTPDQFTVLFQQLQNQPQAAVALIRRYPTRYLLIRLFQSLLMDELTPQEILNQSQPDGGLSSQRPPENEPPLTSAFANLAIDERVCSTAPICSSQPPGNIETCADGVLKELKERLRSAVARLEHVPNLTLLLGYLSASLSLQSHQYQFLLTETVEILMNQPTIHIMNLVFAAIERLCRQYPDLAGILQLPQGVIHLPFASVPLVAYPEIAAASVNVLKVLTNRPVLIYPALTALSAGVNEAAFVHLMERVDSCPYIKPLPLALAAQLVNFTCINPEHCVNQTTYLNPLLYQLVRTNLLKIDNIDLRLFNVEALIAHLETIIDDIDQIQTLKEMKKALKQALLHRK